jgi:hypothetical protein
MAFRRRTRDRRQDGPAATGLPIYLRARRSCLYRTGATRGVGHTYPGAGRHRGPHLTIRLGLGRLAL